MTFVCLGGGEYNAECGFGTLGAPINRCRSFTAVLFVSERHLRAAALICSVDLICVSPRRPDWTLDHHTKARAHGQARRLR